MRVQITALKAPWPAGAKAGDVVELPGDKLPGWAIGKCVPSDADATLKYSAAERPEAPADVERLQKQAAEYFEKLQAEHTAEVEKLQGDAAAVNQSLQDALAAIEKLEAENAELKGKVATAEAALQAQLSKVQPSVTGDGSGAALPPVDGDAAAKPAAKTAGKSKA